MIFFSISNLDPQENSSHLLPLEIFPNIEEKLASNEANPHGSRPSRVKLEGDDVGVSSQPSHLLQTQVKQNILLNQINSSTPMIYELPL